MKLVIVLVAGMLVLSACYRSDPQEETLFNVSGVVLAAQAAPERQATPAPTALPQLRARGALALKADLVPEPLRECAFPTRQEGRRLLIYWTADTIFSPSSIDDEPRGLTGMRLAIEGRIERPESSPTQCSLFAESVRRTGAAGGTGSSPAPTVTSAPEATGSPPISSPTSEVSTPSATP